MERISTRRGTEGTGHGHFILQIERKPLRRTAFSLSLSLHFPPLLSQPHLDPALRDRGADRHNIARGRWAPRARIMSRV